MHACLCPAAGDEVMMQKEPSERETEPLLGDKRSRSPACSSSYHHFSPNHPAEATGNVALARPVVAFLLAACIFIAVRFRGQVLPGLHLEASDLGKPPSKGKPTSKTWECGASLAEDGSVLPVLNGADVVSFFTLGDGEAAMYGTRDHEVVYNGYTFRFVTARNKAVFEASPLDYVPAWGGFCSWGIARETFWSNANLGPQADPNSWLITDDFVLHVFRSEAPKKNFMEDVPGNINAGNHIWEWWWGEGRLPGANATGSPMDTSCICNHNECADL